MPRCGGISKYSDAAASSPVSLDGLSRRLRFLTGIIDIGINQRELIYMDGTICYALDFVLKNLLDDHLFSLWFQMVKAYTGREPSPNEKPGDRDLGPYTEIYDRICRAAYQELELKTIKKSKMEGTSAKDGIQASQDVETTTEHIAINIDPPNSKIGTDTKEEGKTAVAGDYIVIPSMGEAVEDDIDGFVLVESEEPGLEDRTNSVRSGVTGLTSVLRWPWSR